MDKVISSRTGLNGKIKIPGDKSISHRAVMFGSLAKGDTEITGFLRGDDCMSTISCFKKLGIDIEVTDDKVIVHLVKPLMLVIVVLLLDLYQVYLLHKTLIQLLMVTHLFKKDQWTELLSL